MDADADPATDAADSDDGFRFDGGDDPGLKVHTDALATTGLGTVLAIAGEERQIETRGEVLRDDTDADSPGDGETGKTEGRGPGETDANPGLDTDEPGDAAARLDALDAATRETAERIRTDGGEP